MYPSVAKAWIIALLWPLIGCVKATNVYEVIPETSTNASCEKVSAEEDLQRRVEQAIRRATVYLIDQQDVDGAWRSKVYGPFRSGSILTPSIAVALAATKEEQAWKSSSLAARFMSDMIQSDGSVNESIEPLAYPSYVASATVKLLNVHRFQGGDGGVFDHFVHLLANGMYVC
jgi:hypothetical protein